jgi:hypothetical protein
MSKKRQILVNANGYPTRTRDRKVPTINRVSGQVKIDASHRFVKAASNIDQMQRQQYIESIGARTKKLSPATRRVLSAVGTAMFREYIPAKGYVFQEYVNRAAIARALGRSTLVPYDIQMLRQLCDLKLLAEYKHPLPRKQFGEIWLGAGAEFVYTIPLDTLYCLLYHDAKERSCLEAIGKGQTSLQTSVSLSQRDNLPENVPLSKRSLKQPLSDRDIDKLLKESERFYKRCLTKQL